MLKNYNIFLLILFLKSIVKLIIDKMKIKGYKILVFKFISRNIKIYFFNLFTTY